MVRYDIIFLLFLQSGALLRLCGLLQRAGFASFCVACECDKHTVDIKLPDLFAALKPRSFYCLK